MHVAPQSRVELPEKHHSCGNSFVNLRIRRLVNYGGFAQSEFLHESIRHRKNLAPSHPLQVSRSVEREVKMHTY